MLLAVINGWRSIHLLHFLPRMCSTQSGRQYPPCAGRFIIGDATALRTAYVSSSGALFFTLLIALPSGRSCRTSSLAGRMRAAVWSDAALSQPSPSSNSSTSGMRSWNCAANSLGAVVMTVYVSLLSLLSGLCQLSR